MCKSSELASLTFTHWILALYMSELVTDVMSRYSTKQTGIIVSCCPLLVNVRAHHEASWVEPYSSFLLYTEAKMLGMLHSYPLLKESVITSLQVMKNVYLPTWFNTTNKQLKKQTKLLITYGHIPVLRWKTWGIICIFSQLECTCIVL